MKRRRNAKVKSLFILALSALMLGCASPGKLPITGVGVALGVEGQTLRIMKVLPDTPAARAGLSPGMVIQHIDDVATAGRRLEDCVAMLRGPAGTKVKLVLIETATSKTNTVELTRERILLGACSPGRCRSSSIRGSAVELPSPDNRVEVFLMGNEQATINRFAQERTDKPVSGRFSNSLNHAFALLIAKAYPRPDVTRLSRATITSLCEEFERLTAAKIGANQRDAWVLAASGMQGFDSVLKHLAALDPKPVDQRRVIEAGLNGMLKASGWDYACVLSQVQADEIKSMSMARETPAAERGVLGLKVDRWPVVEAVPDAPAAEAGVRNGDVVVGVNGEDIARVKTVADALKILQGPPGGIVRLTVKREGKTLGFEVTRASIATTGVGAREVEPGVLLIKISTFEGSGIAATVKRLIHTRITNQESVVILDLRDNPGGRPEEANGVADIFLDSKLLEICEFRDGTRIAFKSNPGAVGARVILLANKGTASGAEMLAMALHDYSRAIIVGENTCGALFGKDIEELSGGQTIVFRMEPTVLSPAGHDYSLTGIPPDVNVHDSRSKEKDEILVRALALARGERSK